MSHAALTAKYRPQTFAQVAGQETVKAILSRASLESKVAPAYLFSGTRGVGKTTLARIFAKALNCREAPTAEPCNVCPMCRAVTLGNAVDVVEIDGASNRGIDDVKRLKEVVGYAPMEGRYKIFIIDEAHMLSREAFNALLKTLEEPPARVTFIMATTESHKFPATIISRCQHFVFKRLSEQGLAAHLTSVLQQEHIPFDESAVRLIARRGAGSVRDSMSLLSQVLALGEEKLTESTTRSVLGLAGQESLQALLDALKQGDTITISTLLRGMLDQGLDIGFFLRELGSLWRNLFMLKQSGEAALPVVELPEDEARSLLAIAGNFSLPHIHASWQMTIEGQRRVLTSLEPALSLELLLLNIAMLPQLLSLEGLSALGRHAAVHKPGQGAARSPQRPLAPPPATTTQRPQNPPPVAPQQVQNHQAKMPQHAAASSAARQSAGHSQDMPASDPGEDEQAGHAGITHSANDVEDVYADMAENEETASVSFIGDPEPSVHESDVPTEQNTCSSVTEEQTDAPQHDSTSTHEQKPASDAKNADGIGWEDILAAAAAQEAPPWFMSLARNTTISWQETTLTLHPGNSFTSQRLQEATARAIIEKALQTLCDPLPTIVVENVTTVRKDREMLQQEIHDHPAVQMFEATFKAKILDYGQIR